MWAANKGDLVKPLNSASAATLLKRIDHALDCEIRSIAILSPADIAIRFSVQDRGREFDWIDLVFEVNGISDARLIDEEKLPHVDMSEGISIIIEGSRAGIGIGRYTSLANLCDSPICLLGSSIKYEEAAFSG